MGELFSVTESHLPIFDLCDQRQRLFFTESIHLGNEFHFVSVLTGRRQSESDFVCGELIPESQVPGPFTANNSGGR